MRGNRLRLAIIGLLVLVLAGFVFLRGPTPHIQIKPETLYSFWEINITNTMATSWLVVALMIGLVYLASRRWELVPRGVQNLLEAIVEGFYNLVVSIAGEKNGRRFFPVVATIFFFILFANWFSLFPVFNVIGLGEEEEHGLVMEKADIGPLPLTYVGLSSLGQLQGQTIDEDDPEAAQKAEQEREKGNFVGELRPFLRGVNTDLNTPLALAIMSAIFVEFWGISTLGFFTYGGKFFNFGGLSQGIRRLSPAEIFQGVIDAFVGFLELISEMVRLISFTFRLFGNMFAGEVVILMFTFLIPLVLTLPFYGLELFVGLIQAFIFAALTLVFGMIAVTHGAPSGAEEVGAEIHQGETAEGRPADPRQ
ncbi:MAG: F0F1 ATP synthase subunit A [Dehalococcoidia bacterium]